MRRLVAAVALLVLAASLSRPFEPGPFRLRARRLARALAGDPVAPPEAAGFWFDPDYAAFLADVRAHTPETATVAVIVPKRPDLYLYQANYQLAPRRVVDERRRDEASFVAIYRGGPEGDARAIAGGALRTR